MTVANTIAIIDYQMGNLFSVQRACEHVGLRPVLASDARTLMAADAAVLPGVGAFGDAMNSLRTRELIGPIKDFVAAGRPFMGICLGMQLVFMESEEFGVHAGLGLVPGRVVKFPDRAPSGERVKVPHVGWNGIYPPIEAPANHWDRSPFRGIRAGAQMYFVHSFFAVPEERGIVLSETEYEGTRFCSSIQQNNVFACQFHPEKSAGAGLNIYKNLASLIAEKGNG